MPTVTVIGLKSRQAETVTSDLDPAGRYVVDRTITGASESDFDGLVIPGGCVGADKLRASQDIIAIVHRFFQQLKPVGVIYQGPWTLFGADVVKEGCTLTTIPTVRNDLENAGGTWVDEEVVCYQGIVSSRAPKDLPAFCAKVVEELEEGRHLNQARSV